MTRKLAMVRFAASEIRWAVTLLVIAFVFGLASRGLCAESPDAKASAQEYLARIGVDRGICVLLASEPADLAIAMAGHSELTVYVQLPDASQLAKTRQQIDKAGLLGTRVYVEQGDWSVCHLADNLADAVIVADELAPQLAAHRQELLRVVRPLGKVVLGQQELTKPYPSVADDWSHAYHGPDNNPQSTDQLARTPYLTQFLAGPYYVPFPEVTVTSQGRIFKAFGHVGYKQRDWPWLNKLAAFNGYNGTLLWKRDLEEGFNIHRNAMVATPEVLYVADSKSCKLLDPATGKQTGEIVAPAGSTGSVWKWMAIQNGVLYALLGGEEFRDPTLRGNRTTAGWPWRPMTPGYDREDYSWGFGRSLFAIDLDTQQVLWQHDQEQSIDGRAVAMKNGRIYYYSPSNYLACLDASRGEPLWRNSDSELLDAIGAHERAQTPRLGFASTAYLKCSEHAVYFAGPQRSRLVAASAADGHLLWQLPHGNYQLVLRDEGLYAMGRTGPSRLLNSLTGEVLAYLNCVRGNCTRATGTVDSIFCRGHDHAGTLRLSVPNHQPQRIAPMRPDCHDGVIAAGGMVYWGPWMCDCSLSLVGNIGLAPAGDFSFGAGAEETERLEVATTIQDGPESLQISPGDWPTYRADNQRTSTSEAMIAEQVEPAWRYQPLSGVESTAAVTAGGMVFLAGSDGIVHALDADSGMSRWTAYTAGPIRYPPAVHEGRLFVGSGDGWIYAFVAATGESLWRFRAAPVERKISVYGRLTSTWPVASGVLVDDGVVYAAAGIASYDGTHVYALDAASGRILWQNNSSGHLSGDDTVTGVSVQGHLLLNKGRLYMAGGNVVSPAVYDTADGRCLNELTDQWGGQTPPADPDWQYTDDVRKIEVQQKRLGKAPRGCELFLVDDQVVAFDRLLYSPQQYWSGRYFARSFVQVGRESAPIRVAGNRIARLTPDADNQSRSVWDIKSDAVSEPRAVAVCANAVLLAGQSGSQSDDTVEYVLTARRLTDGSPIWREPLPASLAWWGLATDHAGRILVTLQDGSIMCFQSSEKI